MEDGVTAREAESMVVSSPTPSKIDREEGKENHVDEAQGEDKSTNGFMKSIISNFVPVSEKAEEDEKEAGNGVAEGGDGGENGGGGGLINNLISNFFHQGEGEGEEGRENEPVVKRLKTTGEEENGGGGGVINNLISNIFHHTHTESNGDGGEEEKVKEEEESKEASKTGELGGGGGGGGGIFPEDGVPTSDEAAFLIHSIHD